MERKRTVRRRSLLAASVVGGGLAITGGFAAQAAIESGTVARISGHDVTVQLQRALNRIPIGGHGHIVVQPGVHRVSRTVTVRDRSVTLEFRGTLKDAFRSWKADFTSRRLDDKGLLAFRNCSVTMRGLVAGYHLDGSAGDARLAGEGRTLLFFDRCRIDLADLWTKDSTGATLQAFASRSAEYRRCRHDRAGQYGVFFLGGRNITIDRVRIRDSINGALSVNRTGWGLVSNRPQHVTITGCDVRGFSAVNSYAGGIVVNEGDHVRATSNVSDGRGRASFAYSFAGCTDVFSRNTALNMSNNSVGTYAYAGIAFELDGVSGGDFDDELTECLGGYLLANNRDLRLAGNYRCDAGRKERLDSGAGKTGMFMIANTSLTSRSIAIEGARCDGGNSFMTGAMRVNGLSIKDSSIRETFSSVFNFEGGVVDRLTITDLVYSTPGAVPGSVIQAADGVLRGIVVEGASARAGGPSATGAFFSADASGQSLHFSRLKLKNLAVGVSTRWGRARSLVVRDSTFVNVGSPVASTGAGTRTSLQGNIRNGAAMRSVLPAASNP